MKYWYYLKAILYTISGVLVLIFNEQIMNYVGMVVGSAVFLYAINVTIMSIFEKRWFGDNALVFDGIMLYFMGTILFLVRADIMKVCLVWAVWSIMREGKELTEALPKLLKKRSAELLDVIESVAIIGFSFIMILDPSVEHAHLHVILLGIELLLEVIFPILKLLLEKSHEKRREKHNVLDITMETLETINDAIIHNETAKTADEKEAEDTAN